MTAINNDPDQLECYSDHAHDIAFIGECAWCGSTDVDRVEHVLPDIKRFKTADPVQAARIVVHSKTAIIVNGVLLDYFTAQYIATLADRVGQGAMIKLRAMDLVTAGHVAFKILGK